MTRPVRVGESQLGTAAPSGEDSQRESSDADAKRRQRRDGVPHMGGPLVRWSASVPKPQATERSGQQQLTAGDQQRNGVLHARMLASSPPWLLARGAA
jgi:hypothetical protein